MLIHRQPYEVGEEFSGTPALCGRMNEDRYYPYVQTRTFTNKEVTCKACVAMLPWYKKKNRLWMVYQLTGDCSQYNTFMRIK